MLLHPQATSTDHGQSKGRMFEAHHFLLAPGLLSAGPTVGEGRFHPFCRSGRVEALAYESRFDHGWRGPSVIRLLKVGSVAAKWFSMCYIRLLRTNPASITAGGVPVSSASSRWDRLRQNGFRYAMLGSCVRIPLRSRLEGSQCHPPPQGGTGCGKMVFDVLC